MNSLFFSIRFRIFAFFLLSLIGFATAIVFSLLQLQKIGSGLDRINECYLPLSKEIAYTQASMRLLEQEHERIRLVQPVASSRAPFYINRLQENLNDVDTFIKEHQKRESLLLEKSMLERIQNTKERSLTHLIGYQKSFELWGASSQQNTIHDLSRHKTELSLSVNQLSNLIGERIQEINEQNLNAKETGFFFGIALSLFAGSLSIALFVVALKTVEPLEQLTEEVQRLAEGNYTHRLQSKSSILSGNEVAVLTQEFNNMAQAVEEREHALSILFERLQRIIDTIDSAIILTENDIVSMLNPAAKEKWKLFVHSPLPKELSILDIGFHEELRIQDELYDVRISPMQGFGLLWVIETVTHRVHDREQLARTRRLAVVGRMLAQITHEVRNPLNAMSLNTEMLFDEQLSTEAYEMLSTISSEIQRLEKITERYLRLSRRRNTELVEAAPKTIIKEILQFSALEYTDVSFSLQGSDATAILNEDAIRSAIRNLLRNAVEANASHINIQVEFTDMVRIYIQDNGDGIEHIDHIFDPFFTTKAQGTGLGLIISQQELAESGCSLLCTSDRGTGTCFEICIPLLTEESSSSSAPHIG